MSTPGSVAVVGGTQFTLPGGFAFGPELGAFYNRSLTSSGRESFAGLYGLGVARTDDQGNRQWGFSLEGTTEVGPGGGTTIILMFGYGFAKDLKPLPEIIGH